MSFSMGSNEKSAKEEMYMSQKLPPPPCSSKNTRISNHDVQIPLPPCVFQPPSKSSSRKGLRRQDQDDPFLAAFKECTKTPHKGKLPKKEVGFGFSCKQSCSVRDGNLVRISRVPKEKEETRKETGKTNGTKCDL
ncbi:hypothetical protein SLEP1_g21774 [Rubroshorea leprosula]|uniref:Uncharacterized protein n=1 Tax=Rubroshorea leprosula TaxID=152421 RepID=A0AAV5JD61_9ROSI|nr:hypothetical protein SLEP1_g21774 [Rubroshorea leprosula]